MKKGLFKKVLKFEYEYIPLSIFFYMAIISIIAAVSFSLRERSTKNLEYYQEKYDRIEEITLKDLSSLRQTNYEYEATFFIKDSVYDLGRYWKKYEFRKYRIIDKTTFKKAEEVYRETSSCYKENGFKVYKGDTIILYELSDSDKYDYYLNKYNFAIVFDEDKDSILVNYR